MEEGHTPRIKLFVSWSMALSSGKVSSSWSTRTYISEWLLAQNGVYAQKDRQQFFAPHNTASERKRTHNPRKHLIKHCPKAPPIHFIGVLQALDDLGGKVLSSAAKRARLVVSPLHQPHILLRLCVTRLALVHPVRQPNGMFLPRRRGG